MATAPSTYSLPYLLSQLGPGGSRHTAQATLNGHCAALWPNLPSKAFSAARGKYRALGLGAQANGLTRYPVQTGKLYHAQLTGAVAATAPDATAQATAAGVRKAAGVWAKAPAPVRQRVQAKVAAASKRGAKQAKQASTAAPATEPTAQASN